MQNLNKVKFVSLSGEESVLGIVPSFRFAHLQHQTQQLKMFYTRNIKKNKNIRIVDQKTSLELAKGKANCFLGNARIEFLDVEILKLEMDKNRCR
jgi:hypothetical protein